MMYSRIMNAYRVAANNVSDLESSSTDKSFIYSGKNLGACNGSKHGVFMICDHPLLENKFIPNNQQNMYGVQL